MVDRPDVASQVLHLSTHDRNALVEHALAGGEDEVCGLLAGRNGDLERIFPIRNAAAEISAEVEFFRDRTSGVPTPGSRRVHYYMDRNELLRTWHTVEDELGMEVIGYYHSHVHSEARPSATDIRLASDAGTMVYVLVGLRDRAAPEVRAWQIVKATPESVDGELVEILIRLKE